MNLVQSAAMQWHSHLGGGVEFPEQLLYNINQTKSKLFKQGDSVQHCRPSPLLEFNIRQFPFEIVCSPKSTVNGNWQLCYSARFLFYLVLKSFPHRTENKEALFLNVMVLHGHRPISFSPLSNEQTWKKHRKNCESCPGHQPTNQIVQSAFSKVGK